MSQLGLFKRNVRDFLGYANAHVATAGSFLRRNLPRIGLYDSASDANQVALTTQVMTSVPIFLAAGDVITNISVRSGQTAAGTPTNWWFALYSSAGTPALLSQTADQTSAAWAANTTKTLALAAPQTITADGIYWVGIHVKATTVPSLLGSVVAPAIGPGERNLAQTSGSALAASAPGTIASPTAAQFAPFVVLT